MYALLRQLLFRMDPELAHDFSLEMLGAAERLKVLPWFSRKTQAKPRTVMGIEFANPVGLAAGLDKNGDYFNALGQLGFGFVEIGTVTPLAQPGNPQPRLFRLPEHDAIINRMGFNNKGVDHLVEQVKKRRFDGVLGINIGKNKDTPADKAVDDYRIAMAKVYPHADYITVNVSSPNTPGLRDLQFGDSLNELLQGLKVEQQRLEQEHGRYVPVAVKIAPDMSDDGIDQVAEALLAAGIDGVIATNTTVEREAVTGHQYAEEAGGLSGAPVRDASTRVIKRLYATLADKLPIIGVGGIDSGEAAAEKIAAGAALIQIYSGFIYRGPALIHEAIDAIASLPEHEVTARTESESISAAQEG